MSITQLETNDVLQWSGTEWKATTVLPGVSASTVIGGISIVGTFTAYEALTAGDAVCLVAADIVDQSYAESNQSGDQKIGDDAARTYVAQGFRAGATTYLNRVDLYLKKTGSPTGNLTVHIYSNSGTTPSASLGSGTITGSDITTSYAYLSCYFANPISLVSGTAYHIVITRTAAVDGTNYFICGSDTSSPTYHPVASAIYAVHEGDATPAWTLTGSDNVGDDDYIDLIFKTYKEDTTVAAQVRQTKATSELRTRNFIGFANSTVAAAASVIVTRFPSKTSLTSITPGRAYYLSDTAGAIATTPGSKTFAVAIGKSTTSVEVAINQPPVGIPSYTHLETLTWAAETGAKTTTSFTAYDEILVKFFFTAVQDLTMAVNGIGGTGYSYVELQDNAIARTTGAAAWLLLEGAGNLKTGLGEYHILGRDGIGTGVEISMFGQAFISDTGTSLQTAIRGEVDALADVTSVTLNVGVANGATGKAMIFGINYA